MALTVGQVKKTILSGFDYEWHIQHFLVLAKSLNKCYSSPSFNFSGHTWCLKIYITPRKRNPRFFSISLSDIGHISLYLRRLSAGNPISLEFYLGLKSVDGRKDPEIHRSFNFQKAGTGYGMSSYFSLHSLLKKKAELLPSGVLTVVCTLRCPEPVQDLDVRSLSQHYKKILLKGRNHDLIIKVGDKELKAHKDILMARSQVFRSMLTHDMSEKNSGKIEAPDCDPRTMVIFLLYVYSGKLDLLDQSNMFRLYYIADKYNMEELKEECSEFIKRSLSISNVCEAIKIASSHADRSLLENATVYFHTNFLEIMKTQEWLSFLASDMTLANELLLKSVVMLKKLHEPAM